MTGFTGKTSTEINQRTPENTTVRKILVLTANPQGSKPLQLEEEVREIEEGLLRSSNRDQFFLQSRGAVRPDDLRRALLNVKPQIVHFCGHGAGTEGLVIENELGQPHLVSTEALAGLFELCQSFVECVVLNACYSEPQATAIAQHIPYVIGTKRTIGDRAAIEFSKGFYDGLGAGCSYENAFQFGCSAIALHNIPEQLTPVIKHRTSMTVQPDPLERYYISVINAIRDGDVVPFLGSEINLCDRQPDPIPQTPDLWDINGNYPPSQNELAAYLDKERGHLYLHERQCPLCDPNQTGLPNECPFLTQQATRMPLGSVSQLIDLREGSGTLENVLSQISNQHYTPNSVHRFFAILPQIMKAKGYPKTKKGDSILLIVTANFDSTLEHAFIEAGQPFDLVSYIQDERGGGFTHQRFTRPQEGAVEIVALEEAHRIDDPTGSSDLFSADYPVILKLYGSAAWKSDDNASFVITEDHYIDYLAHTNISKQFPAPLLAKLERSHLWFLGYSLNYWNHRVILHRIWSTHTRKPKKKWWVIPEPTPLEKDLWRRSVDADCIRCPSETFIQELAARLEAAEPY